MNLLITIIMLMLYCTEQREQANYAVLRLIQEDTAGFSMTNYRSWLDSADGIWARREMVNTYLHEAKYDTALSLAAHYDTTEIHSTADSIAFKNYKDYIAAYSTWMQTDSSIMRLYSAHKAELISIAEVDEHKRGSNAARNVLNFFYDSTYFTPAYLPEVQYGKRGNYDLNTSDVKQQLSPKETVSIKLYPNPAQNSVTVEYTGVAKNSKLHITDVLGVLYETKTLEEAKGKLILNTANYTNGIYLARVETEGKNLLKQKFIILK